jgi:hypothetical protein
MAYLLRFLILFSLTLIFLTILNAFGYIWHELSHIKLAIATYLLTIFVQAFVMFYFIGVARLVNSVYFILTSRNNLNELFDTPPDNLEPYLKKVSQFVNVTTLSKRQTFQARTLRTGLWVCSCGNIGPL